MVDFRDCLAPFDVFLGIVNQTHLRRVMREYIEYYNTARPHQGICQQTPIPFIAQHGEHIAYRNVLGGIIHSYYRDTA